MHLKSILNVVSRIIFTLGLTMFLPVVISFFYNDSHILSFIISSFITITLSLLLFFFTKTKIKFSIQDGFATVSLAWFFAALFSTLPYLLTGVIDNFTDAFFESMSGVTTTGATIIQSSINLPNGIESLPKSILFWRSFTQWIGGMGIIVFSIAILPLLGVGGIKLFKAEVPGPITDKIKPRVQETAKTLWLVYIGFTFLQISFLFFAGMPFFDSICHAFTTMPTGGFSIYNESIGAYESIIIQYAFIIFMFIAGVNFTLHFKALSGNLKSYTNDYEFKVYFFIVFFISILIFFNISNSNSQFSHENYIKSLFQTVAILTGTGYTNSNYEIWPFFSQLLLFFLMFFGAMGGSTSGGMKISRIVLLIKYSLTEIKRMIHSRAIIPIKIGNRTINDEIIRNTLGFFLIYLFIFVLTSLVLTFFNLDFVSALGASASAIGNIGPAFGDFGPTDTYKSLNSIAKWLLCFCMLLGRLEIFTILVFINSIISKK